MAFFVRESIFRHSAVDEHAQLVQGSVTSAGPGLAGGTTMGLEPEPWCSWVHKTAPGEMGSTRWGIVQYHGTRTRNHGTLRFTKRPPGNGASRWDFVPKEGDGQPPLPHQAHNLTIYGAWRHKNLPTS